MTMILFCLLVSILNIVSATDTRPNVILILADDQSNLLDSISHMPKLKNIVIDEGVTVNPMYVTTPVCCPARASLYTGKYIHNIGVLNNSAGSGGCSSLRWQEGPEKLNIAHYMSINGYSTSFAGKYMNNYGYGTNTSEQSLPQCLNETFSKETSNMRTMCSQRLQHIPRGWDGWQALRGNSIYYNYTLSNNGVPEVHGDDYHEDYLTDLVSNRSVDFINEHFANDETSAKPLFMVMAVPAAHEPADPAPQYVNYADGLSAPRTPNFNMVMNDDARHWMIANVNGVLGGEAMNDTVISFIDYLYRRRLSTLQSVDDMIEFVTNTLAASPARGSGYANALEESFIVYTADNGYHLGQFAVGLDKRQPYETDVMVPFFARGPGIPKGSVIDQGALISIDLAPTFLEMAGVSYDVIDSYGFDGSPMLSYLNQTIDPQPRDFLLEYFGESVDGCYAYLNNDIPGDRFDRMSDGVNCGLRGPDTYHTPPYWNGTETWSSIQDTTNNTYTCLRSVSPTSSSSSPPSSSNSVDTQYCTWISGEVEYFDIVKDPWQLNNLAADSSNTLSHKVNQIEDAVVNEEKEKFKQEATRKIALLKKCQGRKACNLLQD